MRLATWNIWWRFGDWAARQAAISETLSALDADVVALQEVWASSHEHNAAQLLAQDLGYQWAYGPSPNAEKWQRRSGDYRYGAGNAVLSRWPIRNSETVVLPVGGVADEGRVALATVIETPRGTLPFASIHLNAGWAQSSVRSAQLEAVGSVMMSCDAPAYPRVVGGDFNASDDCDEIRAFVGKRDPLVPGLVMLDAWRFVHAGDPGHTWSRENPHVRELRGPSERIDYLFVGPSPPDGRGEPVDAGLFGTSPVDGVWPSDHFGVWVDVRDP